jgi:hypothetical protein
MYISLSLLDNGMAETLLQHWQASFSTWSMSYQRKARDWFLSEPRQYLISIPNKLSVVQTSKFSAAGKDFKENLTTE